MSAKKILIVEDEPDMTTHLTALFGDNGYSTSSATDGEQGMEMVLKDKPDLITLDIVMPNESGVRLLRNLKKNDELKKIPVIIVTGLQDFKTFVKKCGAVPEPEGLVDKPVNEAALLEKVRNLIG
jgi:DNA-binding response OmpR family regulator